MPALTPLPSLSNAQWKAEYEQYLTPNYGERRLAIVRGKGSFVWDADGKQYLDFVTGISVNNLGHCHPAVTAAIAQQAAELVHCSNLYYIPVQIQLAKLLVENSFADRVFFCNSGAEANEAAIKIARRWMRENCGAGKHQIITMRQSFHGRTMATLTATGQDKVKLNFEPLLEGFIYAPFNDIAAIEGYISGMTGAIMIEPVQGEGGVVPADPQFLKALRELCDKHKILLIFDEVQCGLGRAGALFAYERYGIQPDIMTLAKSIGGGMAMGAMLCTQTIASAFSTGAHGSTMGGNPLACAAATAYLNELISGGWPARAAEVGEAIMDYFKSLSTEISNIIDIRGMGLMIGIELRQHAAQVKQICEEEGLLINVTAGETLRLLPPLNVSEDELNQALGILIEAIKTVSNDITPDAEPLSGG